MWPFANGFSFFFSSHFHSVGLPPRCRKSNIAESCPGADEERHWHFRILVSPAAAIQPSATLPTLSRPSRWFSARCNIWEWGSHACRPSPRRWQEPRGSRWQPQAHYFCHGADPCWVVYGGTVKIVSLLDGLFSKAPGCGRLNGGLTCADRKKYLREGGERTEGRGGSFQCAFFRLVQSNFQLRYILEPCEHRNHTHHTHIYWPRSKWWICVWWPLWGLPPPIL